MGLNAQAYVKMLKKLLPRGGAWRVPSTSIFYALLQAMADEMVRLDSAISGSMDEADPATTTDLLEDWERIVGIPDPCTGIRSTILERRYEVLSRLASRGGQSRYFFIALAASIGYTITITEFDRFLAGSKAGDGLYNKGWIFAWRVNATSNQASVFRAGTARAGNILGFSTDSGLECLINRHKPAHTVVLFSYT